MLISSIKEFEESINKLREHLVSIRNKENILEYISAIRVPDYLVKGIEQQKESRTEEKVFNYNGNIISLYGYWERYIENVIKEYIKRLSELETDFSNLPHRIQDSYFELIKSLHGKLTYPKYCHYDEKYLVNSLYHSLSENCVDLIADVYLKNGGNYRFDIVKECIWKLGLEDFQLICKYPDLKHYFDKKGYTNIEQMDSTILFFLLNDLVNRRNEIAHGGSDPEIFSLEIFEDYINFLQYIAKSINSFLSDALLDTLWKKNSNEYFKPYKCFSKKKVVVVNTPGYDFAEGGKLLAARPHGGYPRYIYLSINSIEVNRQKVEQIQSTSSEESICLCVGEVLNEKWRLKVV